VQIGSSSWTAVSAGDYHTAAIKTDGILFTWGLGTYGRLGDGTTTTRSSPVQIGDNALSSLSPIQIGSSSWTAVSAGASHTAAIRSGGTLFTWGNSSYGQLGDGTTTTRSSPVQIGSSSWTLISAGSAGHTIGGIDV
jgi:alpha-tubulin suppressor-like RCC1 family protein